MKTHKKNKNMPLPLRIALFFVLPYDDLNNLSGDFEELYYHKRETDGNITAFTWLLIQIIKSAPGLILNKLYLGGIMFKSYIKMGLKNFKKNKVYSVINTLGLSIGLACCILIMIWLQDELSYDRFHDNGRQIFRVVQEVDHMGQKSNLARTPVPLAKGLKENFPEIIGSTNYMSVRFPFKKGTQEIVQTGALVDEDFLDMFSFNFLSGDISSVLNNPTSIVISSKMAAVYFGNQNPIGETLIFNATDFIVKGVLESIPNNSHLQFDFLINYSLLRVWGVPFLDQWNNSNNANYTYVLINKNTDTDILNGKVENIITENVPEYKSKVYLQPLSDIHLYSDFSGDMAGHGNINYVYISLLIGVFVLFIACFNFMNLSTAKAGTRACEIGIRKVSGASKKELISQFLVESVSITMLSLLIAFLFVYLILPSFNTLAGKTIKLDLLGNSMLLWGSLLTALLTGLFAGSYPALILSSIEPASVLKGSYKTGNKGLLLRKILVITQFGLSTILIIGTLAIISQLDYLKNKNLGFEKDHLLYFSLYAEVRENYDALKNELLQNNSVVNVASCSHLLTDITHVMGEITWEGKDPSINISMNCILVDEDFTKTLGMELVNGRAFSKEFVSDELNSFIINEEALSKMGLNDPVGKKIKYGRNEGVIVGVVKNFHFKPLQNEIEPMVLWNSNAERYVMYVKIRSNNMVETISSIGAVWNSFAEGKEFDPKFLDDAIDAMYENEKHVRMIFQFFAFLAILISCMGLFGLTSYITEQRKKEIGLRKVVGASIANVVLMILKDFVKWVLISNLIAWPLAYYAMNSWLQNFAYRIDLGIWIFLLSSSIALLIALITVSFQTFRAALANPVDSLRYE